MNRGFWERSMSENEEKKPALSSAMVSESTDEKVLEALLNELRDPENGIQNKDVLSVFIKNKWVRGDKANRIPALNQRIMGIKLGVGDIVIYDENEEKNMLAAVFQLRKTIEDNFFKGDVNLSEVEGIYFTVLAQNELRRLRAGVVKDSREDRFLEMLERKPYADIFKNKIKSMAEQPEKGVEEELEDFAQQSKQPPKTTLTKKQKLLDDLIKTIFISTEKENESGKEVIRKSLTYLLGKNQAVEQSVIDAIYAENQLLRLIKNAEAETRIAFAGFLNRNRDLIINNLANKSIKEISYLHQTMKEKSSKELHQAAATLLGTTPHKLLPSQEFFLKETFAENQITLAERETDRSIRSDSLKIIKEFDQMEWWGTNKGEEKTIKGDPEKLAKWKEATLLYRKLCTEILANQFMQTSKINQEINEIIDQQNMNRTWEKKSPEEKTKLIERKKRLKERIIVIERIIPKFRISAADNIKVLAEQLEKNKNQASQKTIDEMIENISVIMEHYSAGGGGKENEEKLNELLTEIAEQKKNAPNKEAKKQLEEKAEQLRSGSKCRNTA